MDYFRVDDKENYGGIVANASQMGILVYLPEKMEMGTMLKTEIFYAKGSNITDDPNLDRWSATRGKTTIDTLRSPEQLRAEAVALAARPH